MALIIKPSKETRNVMDQERSLILTFIAFALILGFTALVILGLIAESGDGAFTSATNSIASGITAT